MVAKFTDASAAAASQQRFRLTLEKDQDNHSELTVHEFVVHDRMSSPFEVNLIVRSPLLDLKLEDFVGFGAAFGYRSEDGEIVAWSGICSYLEQVRVVTSEHSLSTYRLSIVPKLWLLTQRRGRRIFQYQKGSLSVHVKVKDIVEAILDDYKIERRWELDDDYPERDYEVQYGETDFAFVSRLLEEAGITYYFEKVTAGEKAETRVVFIDHPAKVASLGEIFFHDQPSTVRGAKFVTSVRLAHDVKPGKFTLRDYDLRRPLQKMEETSALSLSKDEQPEEKYEQYHYWPGVSLIDVAADGSTPVADEHGAARHQNDEEKARAQRAAEATRVGKRYVEFDSNEKELAPGKVFSIKDHPHDEVTGQKLLVVETIVQGSLRDWRLVGASIFVDDKLRYRPALRTPKPRVMGVETAIVVGPKDQEIHADELGRVRVRFQWDREAPFDETAACWLRVSQQWAGAGFGWMLVPRVGQEVVVDFFEGDPNMPVVIGRLHSSTQPVPRSLPKYQTQSTWRSASSKYKDGCFNEIMIEDAAGKELLFMQAQRDLYKLVKHDDTERTGKNRLAVVGASRVSAIAARDSHQAGKQLFVNVVKAGDLRIPEMGEPETSALPTYTKMVDGKIILTTGKATVVLDGGDITIDAEGGLRFSAKGSLVMKGSTIYLNDKPARFRWVAASKAVADPVKRPDRMLKAVERLFWEKQIQKQLAIANMWVALPVVPTRPPPASTVALAAQNNEPADTPAAVARNQARITARRHVAQYFYETNGTTYDGSIPGRRSFKPDNQADRDQILSEMGGIDFNHPVVAVVTPPPDKSGQWQRVGGNQGNYYATQGTPPTKLGIADYSTDASGNLVPKICKNYIIDPGTPALRTTASPQPDFWSAGGSIHETTGGGEQYYIGDLKTCHDDPAAPPVPLAGMESPKGIYSPYHRPT